MTPTPPDPLFEHLPHAALLWSGPPGITSAPRRNAAYDQRHPAAALPDTARTWPDGVHVRRLPTHGGDLRFCRVHVATLPGAARLALIEDVHEYHTDPLTGLLDRRALQHDILSETPGSVVLLGIEGLGGVNHTLGHAAGDDLLRALATLLAAAADAGRGQAYRLGGDVFVLHTPRPVPAERLDHLQGRFQRAACRLGVRSAHVFTGTAHAPQHGNTLHHLILHADAAISEDAPERPDGAARFLGPAEPEVTPHPARRPRGWAGS
ncbi:diguanylate cyclase (GGDEF)-like protein [Deinococcus metalli]|uniref:Diguanylate cyclase (GGDEF)-like protein n=1 Tax=Deinococcus metalli TaxID=1141878 RepID=A0A7W8KGD4_9DEIO|nr:diguanylate cyclase [Deinococcus metalli]MBB5377605.1 diguanylate cyclase (GGDEF)-like protein [Deinococcus metalli]GHF52011.1 hypothetical protein GCM10017781_30320 [Deinococcus metalli]